MVEPENYRAVPVPEKVLSPPDRDRCALETIERSQSLGAREESILARQVEEFRQERERWELLRQQEVEQLRREGILLVEAWRRLEAEERHLLAERELVRRGAGNGQQSILSPNAAPSTSRGEPAYSAGGNTETGTGGQEHVAWLQFQQLRREIQKYGRHAT